jgi:hypothetical protein
MLCIMYTFLAFFSFLAFLSVAGVSPTAISSASLYTGSVAPLELPPDRAVYSSVQHPYTYGNIVEFSISITVYNVV